MHILFIHQNFPAQFGHIAAFLARTKGYRCTFLSEVRPGAIEGVDRIQYQVRGGATAATHYCSCSFENVVYHSDAIIEALKARPDIRPDLIVAHSGFLSAVYLRELYDCPIVNYFEYFYHTTGSDMDFRPEFPSTPLNRLRARTRNAHLLLDLENCDLGYCPTRWQLNRFPKLFRPKLRNIFDGIDTQLWRPRTGVPRQVAGRTLPDDVRIVTYVSRGMESLRGFDIFMKAARLLCERRRDVVFVIVGEDRVCYGGDEAFTAGMTFKEWVLSRDSYDLSRFIFTGSLPPPKLAELFAISDLHIYLTAPFVLSWSLLNALACGTTVLASNTAPVREMIVDGLNGLLIDFFDIEQLANRANDVLNSPADYKRLGQAGVQMIQSRCSMEVCIPRMIALYEEAFDVHAEDHGD
jgi:glycosyltransferase involved in cell wall biosynthesis